MTTTRQNDWATSSVAVARISAVGYLATILFTWSLWMSRSFLPNIAVVDPLGDLPWAVILVVSTAVCIWKPRVMALPLVICTVLAMLGDQLREQPEILVFCGLIALPFIPTIGLLVTRWFLASMWLWAGTNKLLSDGWWTFGGDFLTSPLHVHSSVLNHVVAVAVPCAEITLGVCALIPVLHRIARFGGASLHAGMLFWLMFIGTQNSAVWPWNAAIAIVSLIVFAPMPAPSLMSVKRAWILLVVVLVYPSLYYAGKVDAYLAFNLYSFNTPSAAYCRADATCTTLNVFSYRELNVPFPPETRIFRAWFNDTCQPGDSLRIIGRIAVFDTVKRHELSCNGD